MLDARSPRWRTPLIIIACFAAIWFGACNERPSVRRTLPVGLLPNSLQDVTLGMSVQELQNAVPAAGFTPYDGWHVKIDDDRSGFTNARFFTGDLYPERPPAADTRVQEIWLSGDAVEAGVIARLDSLLRGAKLSRRCVQKTGSEILVWENGENGWGVELTLSRNSPHRAHLRLFDGGWKEAFSSIGSVAGSCASRGRTRTLRWDRYKLNANQGNRCVTGCT